MLIYFNKSEIEVVQLVDYAYRFSNIQNCIFYNLHIVLLA